ncbi:phosphate ABC transporter substrate-binding protein PstS [Nocardioides jejuensis]|uniref:Phosphate-binding protein n=1 Tax=Nocardioides jejuensis TaxID=2502782 RepID=A0A4R1CG21_9ACTN|nr:phosphate ABC transporter substrate-binding protein PstS [Nocardioides jejuensis]TCJ30150.1 phosphate ABC transporter substrate-binding protein PstS [Nocardioides jejuensis]
MIATSARRVAPAIVALALGVSLTACGDQNGGTSASGLTGTLNGGGSSAQATAQDVWKSGFQTDNSGATINYNSELGSGGGRTGFNDGSLDFAGSDSYIKDDASKGKEGLELTAATARCGGEAPVEVPAYVSPIAVIYNVKGVDNLQLTAGTLAKIFNDKITKWNDAEIVAENPGAKLPDAAISPVHRSDESGTTENFTDYLAQAAGKAWPHAKDKVWPAGLKGESAAKTDGVVGAVTSGENTIGYADHSAIGDLTAASIQVGKAYVAPSAEGAAKTLAVSKPVAGRSDVDMAMDIDRTTTEAGAYPIILASYLIACQHYDDAATADLVKGYLSYAISVDGQNAAADKAAAGSAPLSADLQAKAAAIVAKIAVKK